jgi:SMC interacting uncharacterized protein involved in chromosome segregation
LYNGFKIINSQVGSDLFLFFVVIFKIDVFYFIMLIADAEVGREGVNDLAEVVNTFCGPSQDLDMKRSLSKSSLSPKRKKVKLYPTTDQVSDDVEELIQRLEDYADKLFEAAVGSEGNSLSEENVKRLAAVRHKISALLPPQYQDNTEFED